MIPQEICLSCGACCAHFRVSFYWGETTAAFADGVPLDLTEPMPPYWRYMKGTSCTPARCVALEGEIGKQVRCAIYARRPTTCREFGFEHPNGDGGIDPAGLARCNTARRANNLPPLG